MMSRWIHGVVRSTNSSRLKRRGDRSRHPAFGDVVDIGGLAVQHPAIGTPQRQAPKRIGDRLPRPRQFLRQRIVVTEERRKLGPERHPRRARERREVDEEVGPLGLRLGQGVAQDQPALGVGIADLDGDSASRLDDVRAVEGRCPICCSRPPVSARAA